MTTYTSRLETADKATREGWVDVFQGAAPVRHLVIDDFLSSDWAQELFSDLPSIDEMPKSRDYMFSNKRELSTLDLGPPTCVALHDVFVGSEMAALLTDLLGRPVVVDPDYVGGGFHAGSDGSFLDLHTDFNRHPVRPGWMREFNLLLYLNPGWERSWGGELELTDDPDRPPVRVEPLLNRLVIMESTNRSFHGYSRISFPAGNERRSIAAYGYSILRDGEPAPKRTTTNWKPQHAGLTKRLIARNWNRLVLSKNRVFGSGTLRNRRQ